MNLEGFDLEDKEICTFHKCHEQLKKKYEVVIDNCDQIPNLFSFIDELKFYQLLNHYKDFQIINIFNLNPLKENVRIINIYLSYMALEGKQMVEFGDVQTIGMIDLPIDLGHLLLTPETKTDRILDIFLNRDIDFIENKEFSDKFLLQASNKDQIRKSFNQNILERISKFPDINIEARKNKLIGSFYKSIALKYTLGLAEVLMNIKKELDSRHSNKL